MRVAEPTLFILALLAGSAPAAEPLQLLHPQLHESSGLAFSHRQPGYLWTHNDSGDGPRLVAFDAHGRSSGLWTLAGRRAIDWEDLAAFRLDDVDCLLIADVGDNNRKRQEVLLHLIREPDPTRSGTVTAGVTLRVRYPDGPHNCEAVAVDPARGKVILMTKSWTPSCKVFEVDLPRDQLGQPTEGVSRADDTPDDWTTLAPVLAQYQVTLALPLITALDLRRDDEEIHLALVGYFAALTYRLDANAFTWADVQSQRPTSIKLPPLKQIEAIAYDRDGTLWITSEGQPAPCQALCPGP